METLRRKERKYLRICSNTKRDENGKYLSNKELYKKCKFINFYGNKGKKN